MNKIQRHDFSRKLAYHAAPTLLGIKCANLISLSAEDYDIDLQTEVFNHRAAVKGLCCRMLCHCSKHALLLVYSEHLLAARLADPEVREMLADFGYPMDASVEVCLQRLAGRIGCSGEFPHEIGIFLDYPLEDVRGFIENRGEGFKLCGCWKVYGCEESARRRFARFEKCRAYLCRRLSEGADLYQALKIA